MTTHITLSVQDTYPASSKLLKERDTGELTCPRRSAIACVDGYRDKFSNPLTNAHALGQRISCALRLAEPVTFGEFSPSPRVSLLLRRRAGRIPHRSHELRLGRSLSVKVAVVARRRAHHTARLYQHPFQQPPARVPRQLNRRHLLAQSCFR